MSNVQSPMSNVKRIGLIAGNGSFPLTFAQAARQQGYSVMAVALKEEAEPDLEKLTNKFYWVKLGHLGRLIEIFKEEKITQVVMAGQVKHHRLYDFLSLDLRAMRLLRQLKDKRADTVLGAVAGELKKEGIELIDSSFLLSLLLAGEGIMTKRGLNKEEWEDINFGLAIAREIARLDIGQTVVVKDGAIVAVEAMEGTDKTIKRAGEITKESVVVKVARPKQNRGYDLPVIGKNTIEVLKESQIRVLAVSAGETLILDKEEVLRLANQEKISIVGVK